MNWIIIIAVGILLLILVIFLVRRNMKDEENFEDQLKKNYPKSRETDVNDSDVT